MARIEPTAPFESEAYEKWASCAQLLLDAAKSVMDSKNLDSLTGDDPALYSVALVCRTSDAVQGVITLIDYGLIVEARTLARSCYENLFWAAALAKKKDEFVEAIKQDDATSQKKLINAMKELAVAKAEPLTFEDQIAALLDELATMYPTAKTINQADTAQVVGLKPAYLYYRILSGDSAHPSAKSLGRYVTSADDRENFDFDPTPEMEEDEAVETIHWTCTALLGVCVAANELIKDKSASQKIRTAATQLQGLSKDDKSEP